MVMRPTKRRVGGRGLQRMEARCPHRAPFRRCPVNFQSAGWSLRLHLPDNTSARVGEPIAGCSRDLQVAPGFGKDNPTRRLKPAATSAC